MNNRAKFKVTDNQVEVVTRYGTAVITVNDQTCEVTVTEVTNQKIAVYPVAKNQINIAFFKANE